MSIRIASAALSLGILLVVGVASAGEVTAEAGGEQASPSSEGAQPEGEKSAEESYLDAFAPPLTWDVSLGFDGGWSLGGDGTAFAFSLEGRYDIHHFGWRLLSISTDYAPVKGTEGFYGKESLTEVAMLYGLVYATDWVRLSGAFGAGMASTSSAEECVRDELDEWECADWQDARGIALPLDAKALLTMRYIALGVRLAGSVNGERPWGAVLVAIEAGRFQ